MTTLNAQQRAWLDIQRSSIERELRSHEASDLPVIFAGVAALRRELGRQIDLTTADGVALFEELHQLIDQLMLERLEKRFGQMAEEARRDPLTGIGHRGAFEQRLLAEIERSRRYQRRLALILFDLDRFKQVNDRFGHPTGDQLLHDFARALQQSLRQSDEPFRIGGDEFAAVLPETSLETGETIIRRIEGSAHLARWATWKGLFGVSWGVSNWPADLLRSSNLAGGDSSHIAAGTAAEADILIRIADQRLYERKRRAHQTRPR